VLFGDEMFGLPAAFFSAGAHEVLGALWPVKDETVLAMMPALHQHLADGLPCGLVRLASHSCLDCRPILYNLGER
jgi:hypothetical protein